MAESLKDVIAKLKQQQNSQTSTSEVPVMKKAIPVPIPIEEEQDESLMDGEDENEEQEEVKPTAVKKKVDPQESLTEQQKEQILMEIEMLHNDGRYRAELLHQLNEINKTLTIVASVLVEIAGIK